MLWKNRKQIIKQISKPEFTEKERAWVENTVKNPVFDKVLMGMALQITDQSNGLHKRSLSPDEYIKILEWHNIYTTILGDLKSDMIDYSRTEQPEDEDEDPNWSFIPGLKQTNIKE